MLAQADIGVCFLLHELTEISLTLQYHDQHETNMALSIETSEPCQSNPKSSNKNPTYFPQFSEHIPIIKQ